ncbi:retrovirus-related pol polyprotein from transposon TNT 1-94 [Tanacetum coccineum]
MKDKAGSNLSNEENDFMLDTSYGDKTMEELTAIVMLMSRIQPADGNAETVPSYDAKAVSEVNASSKVHEQVSHVKRKTIIQTYDDDQIDSNIIFDDPYVKNNDGMSNDESNDHDEYHKIQMLAYNVQKEAEIQKRFNNELKKQKLLLQQELETFENEKLIIQHETQLTKKAFKEREDRYLDDIVDLKEKPSSHDRIVYKMGQSIQTSHMLGKEPNIVYDPFLKAWLGYKNPKRLKKAIAAQPKMYDSERLHGANLTIDSPDFEKTLEDAEKSRLKLINKMVQLNYAKLNALYETFVPQQESSVEQTYFSIPSTYNSSSESKEVTSELLVSKIPNESKLLKMFDKMGVAINDLQTMIDNTLLKDRQQRRMSDSKNSLREFYKTDVIPMSDSLSKNLKELKDELIEEKNELLKADLEKSSSDSKDIQANLLKRIKILENDLERSQTQTDGNAETVPSYDAKAVSEVNASSKVHEQVSHVKCKTIIQISDDDQIDFNIIFDYPYVENNGGTSEHDLNAHDEYHEIQMLAYNLLGYNIPTTRRRPCAAQPKMYDGERLDNAKLTTDSPDSEETLKDAEKSRLKMRNKMNLKELKEELIEEVQEILNIFDSMEQKVNRRSPKENILQNEIDRLLETQHKKELDELIEHVNQKTYAYADMRAQNQDLLITIYELKNKLQTIDKGKNVNTKFDKFETSGILLCVTPLPKNIAIKAKKVSNTKVPINSPKPVTPHLTPKNEQSRKHNENVLARGIYRITKTETQTLDSKTNINVCNSTCVESSNSVKRPKSKDTKSKDIVLKNNNDKRPSAHVRKMSSSVSIDSNSEKQAFECMSIKTQDIKYKTALGHNHFQGFRQFCDGDLEVAFRSNTCYVRNLEGDDLLTGSRDSNLYTISISEMAASSPVCLMSRATSTKSWLWHRRLSHLNFGTINQLTSKDLVDGLPKFKYNKDHLCSACEQGKSKKASLPPKLVPSTESKLELLHMDLCGPMRVASINGKKYILVIVDDYSRYGFECNNSEPIINCTNFQDSSEDLQSVPLKTDLDNLFGSLYEEYYATSLQEVSDNSATNTLDNENTSSSSSIVVEEDEAPQIESSSTEQVVYEPNSPVLNENADELLQEDDATFDENVFYNAPQTPMFEEAESSSTF